MAKITATNTEKIKSSSQSEKRAVINYPGGKHGAGSYQTIINQISPLSVYIEPFVGSGGVFHNLALPRHTIINDLDKSIIDKYQLNANVTFDT